MNFCHLTTYFYFVVILAWVVDSSRDCKTSSFLCLFCCLAQKEIRAIALLLLGMLIFCNMQKEILLFWSFKVRTFCETHKIWKILPYGFDKSADLLSKSQNHEENWAYFFGLLRKAELYDSFSRVNKNLKTNWLIQCNYARFSLANNQIRPLILNDLEKRWLLSIILGLHCLEPAKINTKRPMLLGQRPISQWKILCSWRICARSRRKLQVFKTEKEVWL